MRPCPHPPLPPGHREQVTYGSNDRFVATDCVVESHELVTCVTAPGIGYTLPWAITVAGQRSTDPLQVSYARPTVTQAFTTATNTRGGTGDAQAADWLTQGAYQARA